MGLLGSVLLLVTVVLAGCASAPRPSPHSSASPSASSAVRDGPEPNPPADLARVPDAEPKLEPIRPGGANKPYEVFGQSYVPMTRDEPYSERGLASWYGRKFQGKPTANGEAYDMYAMTAAHPTLPIPSYARVRNPANGREVVVRINDRGPFHAGRIVDLSYTAALKLDLLRGVAPVELQRITAADIRTGAWRRGAAAAEVLAAVSASPATPPPSTPTPVPTPVPTSMPIQASMPTPAPIVAAEPVADAAPARGFWVQLGAFRAREGAESFQRRIGNELDWLSPLLAVFDSGGMFRLQAGPYPGREEARSVAERVREGLRLVPVIVERR